VSIPYSELQSLTPSAEILLFVLDATVCGGSVNYFYEAVNALGTSLVWQGQAYAPFPIKAEGFEWSTKGPLPRPKLRVSALDGVVGGLVRDFEDLVGAKVILKRTHAKYLDAVNFPGNYNPTADPTACSPDDPWIVERKSLETSDVIEFELVAPMDKQNARVPGRRVTANVCGWNDAADCPFSTGGLCVKTLSACKANSATVLAVGVSDPAYSFFVGGLPFGAFPGTARIR